MKTRLVSLLGLLSVVSQLILAAPPAGYYYTANGKSKAELKSALHVIVSQATTLRYGGGAGKTWEGFYNSDQLPDHQVWDMYSNQIRYFNGYNAVSGMHIEHSLPKSWWGGIENNAYRDLYHLYPSDGITNSTKNNLPLGEVVTPSPFDNGVTKIGMNVYGDYIGRVFEPADEYKGDFARSYFYISTAYENFESLWQSPMMQNNTYPVWESWARELLLKWHRQDPVSDKEKARIEAIYAIQGNRNPFIDYPELVEYIWGKDTLKTFSFPVETEAFLISPNRFTNTDFEEVYVNSSTVKTIAVHGANFDSEMSVSLKRGDQGFSLSSDRFTANQVNTGVNLTLTFLSNQVGEKADTVVLAGGGLKVPVAIPLRGVVTSDFLVLDSHRIGTLDAAIGWVGLPLVDHYEVDLYQGNRKCGDLLIASYVEGSSWNKAIVLYNGTGATVDLGQYSIRKQNNGNGPFTGDYPLTGTLANGRYYVLVHKSASNSTLLSVADQMVLSVDDNSNILAFNGNDAVALYRNGISVDVVGVTDDASDWGKDVTLVRKNNIVHPATLYSSTEWEVYGIDNVGVIKQYVPQLVASPTYILQSHPVGDVTQYGVEGLQPNTSYTYSVAAYMRDGSTIESINTKQFTTNPLETPMVLEGSDITSNSFVANWESVPYSTGYEIDLYTITYQVERDSLEEFNGVGSGGIPLPAGWTGTASGNYTSTTSSGKSPNSIALKNSGEWLMSPDYYGLITQMSFMYRFPSSGSGSYLIVEGKHGDEWLRIDSIAYQNTSKSTKTYTFDGTVPFTNIRWTYANKLSSNLAIDDVIVTYCPQENNYIHSQLPVSDISHLFTDLENDSDYYYRLRASYLGITYSEYSESVHVVTGTSSVDLDDNRDSKVVVWSKDRVVHLSHLSLNSAIRVFTVSGISILNITASEEVTLPVLNPGVYMISISSDSRGVELVKIII